MAGQLHISSDQLADSLVQNGGARGIRFYSHVAVIPAQEEVEEQKLPRLTTKRVSLNLSRSRSGSRSPTSEQRDPFGFVKYRLEDDENFIPDPPRVLSLKMPTLTTRRKRATSHDRAAPSILAKQHTQRKRTKRDPNLEACPVVSQVTELPTGSPSTSYRIASQNPSSPTGSSTSMLEDLHECCAKCQVAYQYGLLPDERYKERWTSAGRKKRERDLAANKASVPGESPLLKPVNDDHVPVLETSATLVDELAKLRPLQESGPAAARRASLVDLAALDADAEASDGDDADEDDDDDEPEMTAPLRRRPASLGVMISPVQGSAEISPDATGPMRRRGTSLKVMQPAKPVKSLPPMPERARDSPSPLALPADKRPAEDDDDEEGLDMRTRPLSRSRSTGRYSLPGTVPPTSAAHAKPVEAIAEEEEDLPPIRRAATTPSSGQTGIPAPSPAPSSKPEATAPLRAGPVNWSQGSTASTSSRPKFTKRLSSLFSIGAVASSTPLSP